MAKGLHERPLSEGLSEVGLLCPACECFTHSYYETPTIAEGRSALLSLLEAYQRTQTLANRAPAWAEYQRARTAFARIFDDEQKRLKRKIGQNAPRQDSTDVLD